MAEIIKKNLNIYVAGFGCCKQEIFATKGPLYDIQRFGVNFVNFHKKADVLVIQGFYNKKSIEKIFKIYGEMKQPCRVFAVGSCMLNKNIFESDSDVCRELTKKINIDIFIPGCPPRPEAFLYALLKVIEK